MEGSTVSSHMADDTTADSPLEAAAGAAGPRAVRAFSVLGNETRLSILLALWEAYDPFAEDNALPFSELRDRVGMRDSGQFNYHLDKLTGRFIRKTDDGYELHRAGIQLVQTVIAGVGIEEPSLEPTEIDRECFHCGAPTAITYEDEWLYLVCTECDGTWGGRDDLPSGVLAGGEFPPTGMTNRSPEEMWNANAIAVYQAHESSVEGVCEACKGPMEGSLDVCDDHASAGVCDNCGRSIAVMAHFVCPVCKNSHGGTPHSFIKSHPAVIAFYYERGIPTQYEIDDVETGRRAWDHFDNKKQELISDDPPRVRVIIPHEGDTLELTLDEDLSVIDITESD